MNEKINIQAFTTPSVPDFQIMVMRLDVNDELISGNKLYKLKPWINKALSQNVGLLSCGGAYSNHLYALAAAGKKYNIQTFALVRGLEPDNLTITMRDCQTMGMTLIPVKRSEYKERYANNFSTPYQNQIGIETLWIPEGGTDEDAIKSCEEIGHEINALKLKHDFNSVWVAVGSGGTLCGIARSLDQTLNIYAVPVMKHWQMVKSQVDEELNEQQISRVHWVDGASYGGFGRFNKKHIEFLSQLECDSKILFDPIYTSKLLRRLIELSHAGQEIGKCPLIIHTGGLQGRRSIEKELNLNL